MNRYESGRYSRSTRQRTSTQVQYQIEYAVNGRYKTEIAYDLAWARAWVERARGVGGASDFVISEFVPGRGWVNVEAN